MLNGLEREPEASKNQDLLKGFQIEAAVQAIHGRAPARGLEQADIIVVVGGLDRNVGDPGDLFHGVKLGFHRITVRPAATSGSSGFLRLKSGGYRSTQTCHQTAMLFRRSIRLWDAF